MAERDDTMFFQHSIDILCLCNSDGLIIKYNQAFKTALGYSDHELEAISIFDLVHPHDSYFLKEEWNKLNTHFVIKQLECKTKNCDNKYVHLSWNINKSNDVIYCSARDNSKKKEFEDLYNLTQDVSGVGAWKLDIRNRVLYVTPQFCELHKIEITDKITLEEYTSYYSNRTISKFVEELEKAIEKAADVKFEYILEPFDSSRDKQWITTTIHGSKTKGLSTKFVFGVDQDITQNIKVQNELEISKRRLQIALNTSNVGIWELDLVNNNLTWDRNMYKMYGIDVKQFKIDIELWKNLVGYESFQDFEKGYKESIQNKKPFRFQFRFQDKSGLTRIINLSSITIYDLHDKALKLLGTNYDITNEVNLAEKLYITEHRFELATEAANVGIWELEMVSNQFHCTNVCNKIFGLELDSDPNINELLRKVHPADEGMLLVHFKQHIKEKWPLDVKFRIKKDSENIAWVRIKGQAARDDNGKVLKIVGSMEDITEAKSSDDAYKKSLMQFHSLTETAPVGILQTNTSGEIHYVNDKAAQLLGLGQNTNYEKNWLDNIHSDDQYKIKSVWIDKNVHATSDGFFEIRAFIDGEESYYAVNNRTLIDENYNLYGYLFIISDVSSLVHTERALRKSENTVRNILDNTHDAIVTFDNSGWIVEYNNALVQNFILSEDNLYKLKIQDLFSENENGELNPEASIKSFMEEDIQYYGIRSDESIFPIDLSISFFDSDGKTFYTAIIRDITKNLENENQLKDAREEAEAANRYKSIFLANMSHEIRTPLNSIIGMADLLMETPLTKDQKRYVENFKESGDNLLAIINDILDISKVESGQLELESTEFNLEQVMEQLSDIMAFRAHEKGIEFVLDIEDSLPFYLIGDSYRLKQIISNLLSNAVKFTETGSVTLKIKSNSIEDNKNLISFEVIDTGVGIPSDKLSHIFDSFTQADSSITRKFGGTGLGLNISQSLIEQMNGEIDVKSVENEGTQFVVRIPFDLSDRPTQFKQLISLRNKRVLLVEDFEANQRVVKRLIDQLGGSVDFCDNSDDAVNLFQKAIEESIAYDFILIDFSVNEKSGLDVIKKLNHISVVSSKTILIFNSNVRNSEILEAKELGVNKFITKPIKLKQLNEALIEISNKPISGNLLIVDDEKDMLEIMKYKLQDLPLNLYFANSAIQALKIMNEVDIDTVFSDYMMPDMDGLEFIRSIRQAGFNTPLIFGSACSPSEINEEAFVLGAREVINKPFNYEQLASKLVSYVEEGIELRNQLYDETAKSEMENFKLKVLLVDDSVKNRKLVKLYLEKSKMEIVEASNGAEALDLFKEHEFDLVLMDMQMPVMDGYTSVKEIRKWEDSTNHEHTPIVALTAFALKGEETKSLEAGCDTHLTKPIKKNILMDTLENIFNKNKGVAA